MKESTKSNREIYYEMAIAWAENYLAQATEPQQMKFESGIITNDIEFLNVSLIRLKEAKGAEQRASYVRIKKFKDFIEKTKAIVAEII